MKNLKKLRTIVIISFMSELINIIALYIGTTQVIQIGKITIITFLATILCMVSLILLLILFNKIKKKNNKYDKLSYFVISSLCIQILTIILSCFSKTHSLIPYTQVLCDVFKFLPILYFYKENTKLIKKKSFFKDKKCILIILISYLLSKISYILISKITGPIFSTITIVGIVLSYVLYIKFLEKAIAKR